MKDLVVSVADIDAENAVRGILSRHLALGIRPITFDVYRNTGRDGGSRARGEKLLKTFINTHSHALLTFDLHGSGRDDRPREAVEAEMEAKLETSGWGRRAAAGIFDPEVEAWIWSDSPHVDTILGWADRQPALREWLLEQGDLLRGSQKPPDPKNAYLKALRTVRKRKSAALFLQLAERVSLDRCHDPAFLKLKSTLRGWFPPEA